MAGVRYQKVPYVPWKILKRRPAWENTYLFLPFPRADLFHLWNGVCMNNVPWISSFEAHMPRYFLPAQDRLYRYALDRLHAPACLRLLALSDFARNFFLIQNHAYLDMTVARKTQVFYGSVEVKEKHLALRQRRQLNPAKLTMCFVGHDFFQKGGVSSVRAYQALKKLIPGTRLIVVSRLIANDFVTSATDADRASMINLLTSDPGIEWHEQLPHEELLALMANCDLGLLPTLDDTFGWSVVEFMSVGVPVITSNVCAMPEIVEQGVNGLQVRLDLQENRRWSGLRLRQGSSERRAAVEEAWEILAGGIVEAALALHLDSDRLQHMSNAAVSYVKRVHDPHRLARTLEDVYSTCL